MKKIMSLMIGLSLIMGAVTFASAQDKKEETKKEKKAPKKSKKKTEETKKEGGR